MQKSRKTTPTEHVTFRIKKERIEQLKKIAKEDNLSLNTLMNQIVETHLNWDLHASEVGFVVMLKTAMTEIIKDSNIENIRKLAKQSAESGAKEIAFYMRGKYGVEEWISIFKDRARMSGFKLKEHVQDGTTTLVLYHDMGESWSMFFETYYETIFYDLGVQVKSQFTDNSVVLELDYVRRDI